MKTIAEIAREHFGEADPCRCGGGHEICLKCNICRAEKPDQIYNPQLGIASIIDATILKADAKSGDIKKLCSTANEYQTASVCVNSQFITLAKDRLEQTVASCTVINFPLGAGSCGAIAAEAEAVANLKLNEIDMVQNLAAILSGEYTEAFESIEKVWEICYARSILLKVILENCYLSKEEIVLSCLLAKKAGADFVKSSTGFGTGGATEEDIALMRETVGPKLGVKASGGIRSKEQALAMIAAGASRIGASNTVALVE